MTKQTDLPKLRKSITLFTAFYAILFIASLVCIVIYAPNVIFALLLGAAVLVRLCLVNPRKAKYKECKDLLAREERMEDLKTIMKMSKQTQVK